VTSATDERRALALLTAAHKRDDAILRAILHEIGADVPALQRVIAELASFAAEYAADWHGEGLDRCLAVALLDAAAEEVGVVPLGWRR
jgi:hypothetical protein